MIIGFALLLGVGACSDESQQQAKDAVGTAAEKGKEIYTEAKDKAKELVDDTQKEVEEAGAVVEEKSEQVLDAGKESPGSH